MLSPDPGGWCRRRAPPLQRRSRGSPCHEKARAHGSHGYGLAARVRAADHQGAPLAEETNRIGDDVLAAEEEQWVPCLEQGKPAIARQELRGGGVECGSETASGLHEIE